MGVMTLILKDYYIVTEETFIQLLELFTVTVFAQEEEEKEAIMIVKSHTCVSKTVGSQPQTQFKVRECIVKT